MRVRSIPLILAITLGLLTGCGGDSTPKPPQKQKKPTVYYRVSSGTGFLINDEGNIVTNAHVVRNCTSISILTARGEEEAHLMADDAHKDLAVLKTAFISRYPAPLRWNISDLRVGDDVMVMGYHGDHGAFGRYRFKKTRISSLKGPEGGEQWLQLESVATRGNSGGPVLDTSGNVIGVVAGMTFKLETDEYGNPTNAAPKELSDVAIPLVALQDFLSDNGISFYESASGTRRYGEGALRNNAYNFIVPVRCVQEQ